MTDPTRTSLLISRPRVTPVLLLATLLLSSGCVRRMAANALADELSSSSTSSFSTDDDLELVGDAVPFALKLMESVLPSVPEHVDMRLALASGYTQYAVVWVQFPAEQQKYDDFTVYRQGLQRSRRLLLRARGYALEGMDILHPGFSESLLVDSTAALSLTEESDVPLLYWLGASWLAAIANSKEEPELIGQLPIAADILHRAEDLQEDWDAGAIHEVLISLEPSLPLPGGDERARAHFQRAVDLSGGHRAAPYVALATAVSVPRQDQAGFEALLHQALRVDVEARPEYRLANEYALQQARFLLDHIDDLFLGEDF